MGREDKSKEVPSYASIIAAKRRAKEAREAKVAEALPLATQRALMALMLALPANASLSVTRGEKTARLALPTGHPLGEAVWTTPCAAVEPYVFGSSTFVAVGLPLSDEALAGIERFVADTKAAQDRAAAARAAAMQMVTAPVAEVAPIAPPAPVAAKKARTKKTAKAAPAVEATAPAGVWQLIERLCDGTTEHAEWQREDAARAFFAASKRRPEVAYAQLADPTGAMVDEYAATPVVDPIAPGHRVMRVGDLVVERIAGGATRDWIVESIDKAGPTLRCTARPLRTEAVTWAHISLDAADLWRLSSEHDPAEAKPSPSDGRPVEATSHNGVSVGDRLILDGVAVEVLGTDDEGFVWRTVDGGDFEEGDVEWSAVRHVAANVWAPRVINAPEPIEEPPVEPDEGLSEKVMLRVPADLWKQHKSGLRDSAGAELHKRWARSGDDRAVYLPRSSEAAAKVHAYCVAAGVTLITGGRVVAGPMTGEAPAPRARRAPKTPKLNRQQKVAEADELAVRGEHVCLGFFEEQWTTLAIRKAGEAAPTWQKRARESAEKGVRVRLYDGKPSCVWDSLDEVVS